MPIKKIKPLIALILSVFLLGPEWTIAGLCFQQDASADSCQSQAHSTPGCMCQTDYGSCSLKYPCECCQHGHKDADAGIHTGHGGKQAFMCAQDCRKHHSSFSLPTAAETVVLTEKVLVAYRVISTPLPCVSPQGLISISLSPPEKPPQASLV